MSIKYLTQQPNSSFENLGNLSLGQTIDIAQLSSIIFDDNDAIVIHDCILTETILDTLHDKFHNKPNKLVAIGIDVDDDTLLLLKNTNKFDIIDFIFITNTQDLGTFREFFHPQRVFYIPQIPKIPQIPQTSENHTFIQKKIFQERRKGKRIGCITFSTEPWFSDVLSILISKGCFMVIINGPEPQSTQNYVTINIPNTSSIYSHIDFSVPTTIESCLTSIYKGIPSFPIFRDRDETILKLLLDVHWLHGYMYPTTLSAPPDASVIDTAILQSRLDLFLRLAFSNIIRHKLSSANTFLNKWRDWGLKKAKGILDSNYNKRKLRLTQAPGKTIVHNKLGKLQYNIQHFVSNHGWNDTTTIAKIVSFHLTGGNPYSTHMYGIKDKLDKGAKEYIQNARNDWTPIIIKELQQPRNCFSSTNGLFNLSYIDQTDYSGVHRSGWQFVYDSLFPLHNSASPVLLDLYLDRTFGWESEFYKNAGVIPYKQYWYGFIHHTFDTTFSKNNCWKLFQSREFLQSLQYSKGIIVLSKHLQVQLKRELEKRGIFSVPVYYLCHPTQTAVPQFTIGKWRKNASKNIVQIGGWLRNTWSFYDLELPEHISTCTFRPKTTKIDKAVLKGKGTDNYYPAETLLPNLNRLLAQNSNPTTCASNISCANVSSGNVSCDTNAITNNWNEQFFHWMSSKINGIKVIEYLDNEAYDELLTQNIVFVNLVDASAVNTLIECIVRNTPIVINKHPAVVELLGNNYPLYFNKLHDIYHILSDKNITRAHHHLKKLSKTKFEISHFLRELTNLFSRL